MLNEQLNEQLNGIYKAIVTDVSCFKDTGKIRCRISVFNGDSVTGNLLNNYNPDEFAESISRDLLTYIIMPFGGGNNFGMFKLPPVNSVGVVTFINGNPNIPLWLGGITGIVSNDSQLISLDYPTDKLDNNLGAVYNDGEKPVFNYDDETSFVIKTKTNTLDDFKKPSTMNWRKNQVENTMIMNADKTHLRHRVTDNSYQELKFYNHATTSKEEEEKRDCITMAYVLNNKAKNYIQMDGQSIILENKNGDSLATIDLVNDSEVIITAANGGGKSALNSTSITLNPSTIQLVSGGATIVLSQALSGSFADVAIAAPNVRIESENISLGNSGFYVVTSPNPALGFTLQDGSLLASAKNIRA